MIAQDGRPPLPPPRSIASAPAEVSAGAEVARLAEPGEPLHARTEELPAEVLDEGGTICREEQQPVAEESVVPRSLVTPDPCLDAMRPASGGIRLMAGD